MFTFSIGVKIKNYIPIMSFCFNFELDHEDVESKGLEVNNLKVLDSNDQSKKKETDIIKEVKEQPKTQPAGEVTHFYDDTIISKLETKSMLFNDKLLMIVDTSYLEQLMQTDSEFKSAVCEHSSLGDIVTHSDLVNQVYEGGLKVWECGVDLAKYLSSPKSSFQIEGKRILELGCGAGLPGLYCVKKRAYAVDFQDYNIEVLKLLTHTNVQMIEEVEDEPLQTKCRYFSGDWEDFCRLKVHYDKYDLILTAETIYNVDNYSKLHTVFEEMLTADGVILVAAKDYYFGVGGGIDTFVEYVNAQQCFDYETVWETKSGIPRKILALRRQKQDTDIK